MAKADEASATAPGRAETQAAEASPIGPRRDAELLSLVQAVNEGRASADDLDKRRVHRVVANVGLNGLAAGETGWAAADEETAAQIEAGLLAKAPAE